MTTKQQFDVLWKAGCKRAILGIIRNKGSALSKAQIQKEIDVAINSGSVSHVLTLAQLARYSLKQAESERLVRRCLKFGWIPDAIHAASKFQISERTRRKVIQAAMRKGLADSAEDAVRLFQPQ